LKAFESEAFFITFNNKYEANLIKAKIRDGTVLIDEGGSPKLFYVDQTRPLYLTVKKGLFMKERLPLYIIKWNSVIPYDVGTSSGFLQPPATTSGFLQPPATSSGSLQPPATKKLPKPKGPIAEPLDPEHPEQIIPEFKDFEGDKTPEYVAKLIDLKIMSNLMGRGTRFNFIWIIIALVVGAIIGYLFYRMQGGG
jgi:hypothetical protein